MKNLHATVIKTIGGVACVARTFDLPVETVKSWHKRGIPTRYWHRVVELAGPTMPKLTIADLDRTKPRAVAAQEAA